MLTVTNTAMMWNFKRVHCANLMYSESLLVEIVHRNGLLTCTIINF